MLRVGEVAHEEISGFTLAGGPIDLSLDVSTIVEAIHCIFLRANPEAATEFRLAVELALQDPSVWDGHGQLSDGEGFVVSYPEKRKG